MRKLLKSLVALIGVFTCVLGFTSCSQNEGHSITVYTRNTTSGTRDGFFTGIGFSEAKEDNTPLVVGYQEVEGNGDMITSIKNDEYGIGYISLSSLEDSGVKGLSFEGVNPTEANVINKTYKLTRNFNYCIRETYTSDTNKNIILALVAYLGTVEGQATIVQHGGIVENSSTVSWDSIKANHAVASLDNSSVTIKVGGSTSVKSIVSALLTEFSAKCGNFVYEYNPTGSSDAYKRTNGSEKDGSNALDLGFASREFSSSETLEASLKGKMCIDAIVSVVNSSNTLTNVTREQLKNIYNGTYTTWSEVE